MVSCAKSSPPKDARPCDVLDAAGDASGKAPEASVATLDGGRESGTSRDAETALEACNLRDDDGDGRVDEERGPALCVRDGEVGWCDLGACFYDFCLKTANDDAICDRRDSDCDGRIDEDIDLNTDPKNCRECGRACPEDAECRGGLCLCDEDAGPDDAGSECDFSTNSPWLRLDASAQRIWR